jgi:SAM-dependent methyltransferase
VVVYEESEGKEKMSTETWPDRGQLLDMAGSFRAACVLGAAAELDLFTRLGDRSLTAEAITAEIDGDLRATRILLDALAALRVLEKRENAYRVPLSLRPLLSSGTPQTLLPMIQHSMGILRGWSQLAWVARAGIPTPRQSSVRGPEADRAAFIAAMHTVSGPVADDVVQRMGAVEFRHVLDVGGASGTWILALLRAVSGARGTIFDLPDAIRQARERIGGTPFATRIEFAVGDFYRDELPAGADFAWVSAIIHQHAREDSRALFAKVYRALAPNGRIAIRDFVMDPDRIRPAAGALFAVNMLANTERGATFTFAEIADDLQAVGFEDVELRIRSEDMNSVVMARRPA